MLKIVQKAKIYIYIYIYISLFVPVFNFSSISRDKRHIYFMLLF